MKKNVITNSMFTVMFAITFLSGIGYGASSAEILPDIPENQKVTIFAAAGTIAAIQQVASSYEGHTGCKVVTNFASSSTLAKQIEAGADFDVYISANPKWMDYVEEKKAIVSNSRQDLLSDRLAFITPAEMSVDFNTLDGLILNTPGPIAVGDPTHVPVGAYTKEALESMNCWETVKDRLVPAHSVRAAQQLVETGQCSLGIVYRAGAIQSEKVKILGLFDESLHMPIRFCAAVASGSEKGNRLLEYLYSSQAGRIFNDAGFSTLSHTDSIPITRNIRSSFFKPTFDINEWKAFLISVKVAAACVLVVATPGILLGYLLATRSFPGRSIVNACIHLPLVIPPVVTGYLALNIFGKNAPMGAFLEKTFGISFAFNCMGAILVAAIMGFPLLVRSVKTAVEMVDHRYRFAANTLGAGPARTFFTITLPLAGPGILAGLVLAFARSLGEFGATAVFVGNIPGKTQTLSLAIYNFMQIPGAESSAMRLVIISIVISLTAMLASELLLQCMNRFSRVRS